MQHTKFLTVGALKLAVAAARDQAANAARRDCGRGFFRSRGAWVVAHSKDDAVIASGEHEFKGTKRGIERLVTDCVARHEVITLSIEGGFNFASSLQDFVNGSYDPWVSEWEVIVWERPAG